MNYGREAETQSKASTVDSVNTLFERVGGANFFEDLVARFYEGVVGDLLLRPLYPDDLQESRDHLALFFGQYWGGPATYNELRGHPRLRMRHAPFAVDLAARTRWMELMDAALEETRLEPEAGVMLRMFFDAVATNMINR